METMKEGKPSDWMKKQMISSFLEELNCIADTTDEENEDLPYDGDLGKTCHYSNYSDNLSDCTCLKHISDIFSNISCSEDNKNIKAAANYETHPQPGEVFNYHTCATETTGISVEMPVSEASFKKELPVCFSRPDRKQHLTHSKMSDVLLRHFPKGELITTCQLIEGETIPEISFTESIDEPLNKPETSELAKCPLSHEQRATNFEGYHLNKHEEINTGERDQTLLNENKFVSKRSISATIECGCVQESSPLISENEDTHTFQNTKKEQQKDPFKRTGSSHELKFGQGQVHYCLTDFSKVASEVKVPKRNDNNKSAPVTDRTKTFPILPSKSVIANDIVENRNYFDSVEVENQEEMSVPELLQQLEMLTQHADAQNHTDYLRLNPKMLPQSDFPNPSFAIYSGGAETSSEVFALHPPFPIQPMLALSEAGLQCGATVSTLPSAGTVEAHCLNPSSLLLELTQGEKMTQILKEQTDQLQMEVEDFSKHMTQETFLLQDKYLVLSQLKRRLDALEQNYLTAREEHRNLQLQNYKDKSINIGKFDPERKVEGEIFRLGTLLEDIHEQDDNSKCSLSPLLTPYESAHSSYSLGESSVNSSITDPPERKATETAFLHKKNEAENTSHTIDVIPQANHTLSLEGDKCNPYPHVQLKLQKRDKLTPKREMELLGKGSLLANKHSPNVMRFLSPEEIHGAKGLGSHSQGKSSQKLNEDEESMESSWNFWQIASPSKARSFNTCRVEHDIHLNILKKEGKLAQSSDHRFHERVEKFDGTVCPKLKIHVTNMANKELDSDRSNENTQKRKTGRSSIFIQGKPTDLSDTNLSSDSEDISACDSCNDSQSEEFLNHETESYKTFNARLHGDRKEIRHRCTRGSRDQFKLGNYKEFAQSCALCRTKNSSLTSYSQKRITTQKVYRNEQPHRLVNRLSERQNLETARTCCASTYDTVILSPQYLPRNKTPGSKSAVNIRNTNASNFNANILSSALDHAIQTANSLKKTTERMVQAVSEDLAKVRSKQL
ncbi:protein AKNAD1 [Struthio camelus]|uniref:protein AKNAD1 n=1 Tax=Struthio camelus TaxID=8801 RepID=UPI003603D9CE